MLVREAFHQVPALILDVDEVGMSDIIVQLDGEVDGAFEDIDKGVVHTTKGLNHSVKLHHVGRHTVCFKVGSAARHTNLGQGVGRSPPIHQDPIGSSPGYTSLQLCQRARQGPSAWKPMFSSWVEGICNLGSITTEIQEKGGFGLLLGQTG